MSDAIDYCDDCETNVMCHMARACQRTVARCAVADGSAGRTPIPGIKAHHRWITDTCRSNRGDVGAMSEAAQTLQLELLNLYKHWPTGNGTRFHIVLTVEEASPPNTEPSDAKRSD